MIYRPQKLDADTRTDRHTDRQTYQAGWQRGWRAGPCWPYAWCPCTTCPLTHTDTDRQTHRHTDTDTQTHRDRERQSETERERDRYRDRHRPRDISTKNRSKKFLQQTRTCKYTHSNIYRNTYDMAQATEAFGFHAYILHNKAIDTINTIIKKEEISSVMSHTISIIL